MDEIYAILNVTPFVGDCQGLIGMVEDAYSAIHRHGADRELRDLSISAYMHNIESVEMASYQILQIVAVKLKNKQIKQLLLENFDEARSAMALLLLIKRKYLKR